MKMTLETKVKKQSKLIKQLRVILESISHDSIPNDSVMTLADEALDLIEKYEK